MILASRASLTAPRGSSPQSKAESERPSPVDFLGLALYCYCREMAQASRRQRDRCHGGKRKINGPKARIEALTAPHAGILYPARNRPASNAPARTGERSPTGWILNPSLGCTSCEIGPAGQAQNDTEMRRSGWRFR